MRYLVAEGAVGPGGRRVRCAHCGHQWFQEPETGLDEALFGHDEPDIDAVLSRDDDDMPFERAAPRDDGDIGADFHSILQKELEETPIPEGVKPVHVHEDITLPDPSRKKAVKVPPEKLGGFATAARLRSEPAVWPGPSRRGFCGRFREVMVPVLARRRRIAGPAGRFRQRVSTVNPAAATFISGLPKEYISQAERSAIRKVRTRRAACRPGQICNYAAAARRSPGMR